MDLQSLSILKSKKRIVLLISIKLSTVNFYRKRPLQRKILDTYYIEMSRIVEKSHITD
ncbi:hypothetical protein LEP1GSC193_3067 [Leptospira alstonii serovar Pingchang str. 80-412]|uniref:Uncharacterized protein n=2 Tax=Leptospira alstonii TaxID=28452 RepID=M6CJ28_9LEPT|nr:hypothetical protein LEP1GSC194_4074 [Leptospira alstonii serovar Sichuan str. 79601]EQA79626.1 hypothetical protein LEP1GSC193_3067 [Leptospira alstonii serovar Pingchang str. 80-412]